MWGMRGQDFQPDTQHPNETRVRTLGGLALAQLCTPKSSADLAEHQRPLPPAGPVATGQLPSLGQWFRELLPDPRKPEGKRHPLATVLTLIALAAAAGGKGAHATAECAGSLNRGHRRQLRRRLWQGPCPGPPRSKQSLHSGGVFVVCPCSFWKRA